MSTHKRLLEWQTEELESRANGILWELERCLPERRGVLMRDLAILYERVSANRSVTTDAEAKTRYDETVVERIDLLLEKAAVMFSKTELEVGRK